MYISGSVLKLLRQGQKTFTDLPADLILLWLNFSSVFAFPPTSLNLPPEKLKYQFFQDGVLLQFGKLYHIPFF